MTEPLASSQRFAQAWSAYQSAVHQLYSGPATGGAQPERGDEPIQAGPPAAQTADLLARSAAVRNVLLDSLSQPDWDQRELAGLKLIAAAAYDLSVGSDLAQWTGGAGGAERSARGAFLAAADLREIIDAPLHAGLSGLIEPERSVLPTDPAAARALLETTIADFLKQVPRQASSPARTALVGLVTLGIVSSADLLAVGAQQIAGAAAPALSPVLQGAASLAGEAVLKLQLANMPSMPSGSDVLKELAKLFSELQHAKDATVAAVEKIYQVARIRDETTALVRSAAADTATERYNQGTQKLQELTARYTKSSGAIEQALRLIGLPRLVLMALPPWGPLTMSLCYISVLGYAIFSGGEYVDWYLTSDHAWLQRVEGLRHAVRKALAADAPATR